MDGPEHLGQVPGPPVAADYLQEVLDVEDPHHLIEALTVDRYPGIDGLSDQLQDVVQRGVLGQADHVGPGGHDIADPGVAEGHHGVD